MHDIIVNHVEEYFLNWRYDLASFLFLPLPPPPTPSHYPALRLVFDLPPFGA